MSEWRHLGPVITTQTVSATAGSTLSVPGTQFVTDALIPALELDALKNSHPIEVEVGHPSEVDEIFDNISYNKVITAVNIS